MAAACSPSVPASGIPDTAEPPARPRSERGRTFVEAVDLSHIGGRLTLDQQQALVGETLELSWNFNRPVEDQEDDVCIPMPNERDWIGLFRTGT